ncbi:SIS domain-containing protein [Streptomyces sp. NPDC054933]
MLDEALLDSPDALARADTGGLLPSVAAAGARVRTAARAAAEAGLADLKPDGRPRTIIIAGPGSAPTQLADLLGALAACPLLPLAPTGSAPTAQELRWTLPGWAGPLDLLLLTTADGTEPGLSSLVEQAYRRGCTVAGVAPAGTPLTGALQQAHGLALPFAPPPYRPTATEVYDAAYGAEQAVPVDPGVFWALLTPLLALTDRIGLLSAPPDVVEAVADRLDAAAARFGPAAETYRNPAKTLAVELAHSLPLVWSEGATVAPAARRFAAVLTSLAGRPALAAALPEAIAEHGALLDGTLAPDDLDDFFRDRVEEPDGLRLRIVLLREPETEPATAAHEAADAHGTPLSEIDAADGSPAETLAELLALTDFAAVYLALTPAEGSSA